jgi:hypothetical protein
MAREYPLPGYAGSRINWAFCHRRMPSPERDYSALASVDVARSTYAESNQGPFHSYLRPIPPSFSTRSSTTRHCQNLRKPSRIVLICCVSKSTGEMEARHHGARRARCSGTMGGHSVRVSQTYWNRSRTGSYCLVHRGSGIKGLVAEPGRRAMAFTEEHPPASGSWTIVAASAA